MQLDRHLESVRSGLRNAAALADDHSQDIARRLGDALDSSVRLSLIDALSEAASEISADLAPGSVEFRLSDGEPQFVVTPPPAVDDTIDDAADTDADDPAPDPDLEDEEQVRFTLRLPASVKTKVDQAAAAEGVSTNTWLLQRVLFSLARGGRGDRGGRGERGARRGQAGGWISPPWGGPPLHGEVSWSGFAPGAGAPPVPPVPPFGPDFPFGHGGRGPGGRRGHRGGRDRRERRDDDGFGRGGEGGSDRGGSDRGGRRFRGWAQ